MSNCKGCESGGRVEHDLSCLADSYMTFTGAHELPEDVRERALAAFIAGHEWATGKAVKAVVKVEVEKRCGTCVLVENTVACMEANSKAPNGVIEFCWKART